MSSWLKTIPIELSAIEAKDFIDPGYEQEAGDKPVGEVSDDLKRLFTLARKLREISAYAAVRAKFESSESVRGEERIRAVEFAKKAELLMEIFWICLKDEKSMWDKSQIGIRKGFIAVWSETGSGNQGMSFLDLLQSL